MLLTNHPKMSTQDDKKTNLPNESIQDPSTPILNNMAYMKC